MPFLPPNQQRQSTSGSKGAFTPLTKILWSFLGVVICLDRGADLHMAQLMPLSLASRLVLPFWYQLSRVVLDKWPLNGCFLTMVL